MKAKVDRAVAVAGSARTSMAILGGQAAFF